MPTKFVQNVAHKTGTSVEHAEKVWQDAKHAVKKGKRQGSWYWGKVVNTFKRMMGIKEHITFAEFKELLESDQGQNKNDTSERAMIHKIVDLLCADGQLKGGKSEANLEKAYDFLESDWGGRLWDKHYELFHQMHPDFEGPMNRKQYGDFKREAVAWYKKWKNGAKLPTGVKPLDKLHEAKSPTIPKGVEKLPKTIMVGKGGYYLVLRYVKPIKAVFDLKRLLGDNPVEGAYMTISKRGGKYMLQAHGPLSLTNLGVAWEHRSSLGSYDDVKPFDVDSIKRFMQTVISVAKLNEDKKEDGVKKSYLDFRGSSNKKELKDEMKREIKRFSKMSHKDKDAYPDDWTVDQKYKAELKKKGKKLPKSEHTKEFERRFGK